MTAYLPPIYPAYLRPLPHTFPPTPSLKSANTRDFTADMALSPPTSPAPSDAGDGEELIQVLLSPLRHTSLSPCTSLLSPLRNTSLSPFASHGEDGEGRRERRERREGAKPENMASSSEVTGGATAAGARGRRRRRKGPAQTQIDLEMHVQGDSFIESLSLGGELDEALVPRVAEGAAEPEARLQSAGLPPLC